MNLRNILSTGAAAGAIALTLGASPVFAQDSAAAEDATPEGQLCATEASESAGEAT